MLSKKVKVLLSLAALIGATQATQGQTLTAAMAAPAGSVDTTKPGFKVRVFKGNARINPTAAAPAELIISGLAIDPGTNLPLENIADRNPNPGPYEGTFFYELPGYINEHEQQPANPDVAGGNFSPTQTQAQRIRPEDPVPGMAPGSDYYVVEYTGFMQLPAGTSRLGVNSDDGFKLTFGVGLDPYALPGSLPTPGLQNSILDGTRGFGNTEANVTVPAGAAGLYPFRLIFWESGGANSGVELYNFVPGTTSGNIYLVNDLAEANSIKTYAYAKVQPPLVSGKYPVPNSTGLEALPFVKAIIDDGANPLNPDSVVLKTDGVVLTTTKTKDLLSTTIVGQPAAPFNPGSVHTNVIEYADSTGAKFTNTWIFTISNYPTIPASYSVGAVDTTKPGFRVKIDQMGVRRAPLTSQSYAAERQIAKGFIDNATGAPFENLADLSAAGPDGYFIDEDVINWDEGSIPPDAVRNTANFPNDESVPGITTSANGNENYIASIESILELKAGIYRFGVNSDDGCRLTFGKGPGDVTGTQVLVANVDRGPTDSFGDFAVTADGFYPFRVMYWETGGGSAAEFFVQNYQTLEKTLINAPAGANVIKAYRESANTPPYISRVLPVVNEPYAFADQDIIMDVTEGALALNPASVIFRLNNVDQTVTKNKVGNVTTITRDGNVDNLLFSGVNTATLIYSYTPAGGGAAVSLTNTWTFSVPPYTRVIPAANRVATADVSGSGFHINKVVQIDRSLDANQGNGGRYVMQGGGGNNMPGPEIELAEGYLKLDGTPYPNLAPADWPVDVDFFNFNWTTTGTANSGLFNSDTVGPGLPGTGTSNAGLDNSVHEIFTYIDLKKGAHIFGINVDDGWTMHSSPNAKDTLGTLLGFKPAPGGNAGQPLAIPNAGLNVIVPEDGIYPFRILFWEGGGGVNIEVAAVDRNTGVLSLINDVGALVPPTQPAGPGTLLIPDTVKYTAYSTYNGPARPWTKFSVYPIRNDNALWQAVVQQSGPGPLTIRVPGGNPVEISNDSVNTRPFGDAIGAIVADAGTEAIGMVLDGNRVTPTISDLAGGDKLVWYEPNPVMTGGTTHTAGLVYAGTTNYWTFTVITNVTVAAGVAKPAAQADQTKKGFLMKVAQSNTGRANTVAAAEAQLVNTAANVASPGPINGAYRVETINHNIRRNTGGSGVDQGNFTSSRTATIDQPFPGLNSTLSGSLGRENFTTEIFAYLDLPKGYQKFGFNGDDGWSIRVGLPGDATGQILYSADRGTGARDIPFAFITPEAGLYPVRVVYWQGGGDGNAEFFTYGPNNSKNLINDPTNPNSIKAYYALSQTDPPQITFSVSGTTLTINWTNGGELETATSVMGPWSGTGDTDGSHPDTIPATEGTRFYRVKR